MTERMNVIKMTHKKTTKGTYVFQAEDIDAPIQTVYVRKTHFDHTPTRLTLTIS